MWWYDGYATPKPWQLTNEGGSRVNLSFAAIAYWFYDSIATNTSNGTCNNQK